MRNEVMFNETMAESSCDAMLEKVMADKDLLMTADMDSAYEGCRKYIDLTKEEFAKYVEYAKAVMNDDGESIRPLTELELEMVAGGWFGSDAWNWVKDKVSSVAKAVKNAVVDTWNSGAAGKIGLIAGAVVGVAAIAATAVAGVVAGTAAAAGAAAGEAYEGLIAVSPSVLGML